MTRTDIITRVGTMFRHVFVIVFPVLAAAAFVAFVIFAAFFVIEIAAPYVEIKFARFLGFNWGVFWALLAVLVVRRAFIVCWFHAGSWLGPSMKWHIMTERDHAYFVQDRLQEIADNLSEIRKAS